MTSIAEAVRTIASGWAKSRCGLPCEIVVRDMFPLDIPHGERDARWCVFMTYGATRYVETGTHNGYLSFDGDRYLSEYDSRQQATSAARRLRREMNAAYDAALSIHAGTVSDD